MKEPCSPLQVSSVSSGLESALAALDGDCQRTDPPTCQETVCAHAGATIGKNKRVRHAGCLPCSSGTSASSWFQFLSRTVCSSFVPALDHRRSNTIYHAAKFISAANCHLGELLAERGSPSLQAFIYSSGPCFTSRAEKFLTDSPRFGPSATLNFHFI